MSDPKPPASRPGQPAFAPPPPPQRRSSRKLVLLIVLALLLVAGLCGGGLLYYARPAGEPVAQPGSVAATPEPTLSVPLSLSEQNAADEARARTVIEKALTAQSTALLSGDKKAFVGFAHPSAKRVAPWLTDRYASLHALGVAQWTTSITSMVSYGWPLWHADVQVEYCFVANCARPLTDHLSTQWNLVIEADPKITEMWDGMLGKARPPWASSVLRTRTGSRVVVAATAANAGRLDSVLAAAEAAARIADGYASAAKPGRYVIYLAGAKEWDLWPYDEEGKWVAGYADEETESVVLNLPAIRSGTLDLLLRHELTHVASLAGEAESVKRADSWWLVEGLAEYAAAKGAPFSSYARRAETAAFVRNRWKGDLRVGAPAKKASLTDASARYGTAFLGVSCLMSEYGRTKTLGFFESVAVQGTGLDTAARDTLGVSWSKVTSTCAAEIRAAR